MDDHKYEEDYRAIWREFYCAIICKDGMHNVESVSNMADKSLELYINKKNYFRELDLKAFK